MHVSVESQVGRSVQRRYEHPKLWFIELPDVSLVICTRNRIEKLRRSVDAAMALEGASTVELIVVDNGSTDATAKYLLSLKPTHSRVSLKVVFEPTPGKGRALNAGWRASSADILAFTDDDCYVAPNYIDAIRASFADPKIGFVGGRVLLYDPTDHEITTISHDRCQYFSPHTFIPAGAVIGANMAFRRRTLEQIGGFDERVGPGRRSRLTTSSLLPGRFGAEFPGCMIQIQPSITTMVANRPKMSLR